MGAISEVMAKAWGQKLAIMRDRSDNPKIGLYLDDLTYPACKADPDVVTSWVYSTVDDGNRMTIGGMEVFRVRAESPHVNVAVISD